MRVRAVEDLGKSLEGRSFLAVFVFCKQPGRVVRWQFVDAVAPLN